MKTYYLASVWAILITIIAMPVASQVAAVT